MKGVDEWRPTGPDRNDHEPAGIRPNHLAEGVSLILTSAGARRRMPM